MNISALIDPQSILGLILVRGHMTLTWGRALGPESPPTGGSSAVRTPLRSAPFPALDHPLLERGKRRKSSSSSPGQWESHMTQKDIPSFRLKRRLKANVCFVCRVAPRGEIEVKRTKMCRRGPLQRVSQTAS